MLNLIYRGCTPSELISRLCSHLRWAVPYTTLIAISSISCAYAQDFEPTVEWTCSPTSISVSLHTTTPYVGVAHTTGRLGTCSFNGTGGTITRFDIPLVDRKKCNVQFDKDTGTHWTLLEVHEHRLLILQQDKTVNLTCNFLSGTVPPQTLDNEEPEGSGAVTVDGDTAIGLLNDTATVSLPLDFLVEVLHVPTGNESTAEDIEAAHDVHYGKAYHLRVSLKEPADVDPNGWRVHSCVAIASRASVELIDSSGCPLDRHLVHTFNYGEDGSATALIPSMFRFPDSETIKFECELEVCENKVDCQPDCSPKLDDPLREEADDEAAVTDLLRSGAGEMDELVEIAKEVTAAPAEALPRGRRNTASTVVHVLERRDSVTGLRPIRHDDSLGPVAQCVTPGDVLLLYKICIVLCIVFTIGCCCNIVFCCMSSRSGSRTKKRAVSRGLPPTTFTKNEFWIPDTANIAKDTKDDPYAHYGELPLATVADHRRESFSSYASVKRRRQADPTQASNRLSESIYGCVGFHHLNPSLQAPSPVAYRPPPSLQTYGEFNRTFQSQSVSLGPESTISSTAESPHSMEHERGEAKYITLTPTRLSPNAHKETYSIL